MGLAQSVEILCQPLVEMRVVEHIKVGKEARCKALVRAQLRGRADHRDVDREPCRGGWRLCGAHAEWEERDCKERR